MSDIRALATDVTTAAENFRETATAHVASVAPLMRALQALGDAYEAGQTSAAAAAAFVAAARDGMAALRGLEAITFELLDAREQTAAALLAEAEANPRPPAQYTNEEMLGRRDGAQ